RVAEEVSRDWRSRQLNRHAAMVEKTEVQRDGRGIQTGRCNPLRPDNDRMVDTPRVGHPNNGATQRHAPSQCVGGLGTSVLGPPDDKESCRPPDACNTVDPTNTNQENNDMTRDTLREVRQRLDGLGIVSLATPEPQDTPASEEM